MLWHCQMQSICVYAEFPQGKSEFPLGKKINKAWIWGATWGNFTKQVAIGLFLRFKIFFMWIFFKVFIEFLLQYCFCFMFWFFGCKACGILIPWSGLESTFPAVESGVLTTGLPGKSSQVAIVLSVKVSTEIFFFLLFFFFLFIDHATHLMRS